MSPFRFLRRTAARSTQRDAPPKVADGCRVYAFGDLHGRHDLLLRLFATIADDLGQRSTASTFLVGLGDYVDRGPESRSVLETLVTGFTGCTLVCLRGNHEQMLLDFLDDPLRNGRQWFAHGGKETLQSYAIDIGGGGPPNGPALVSARDQFARAIPPSHLIFLQRTPLTYTSGDYLFVHAGVRRDTPLHSQSAKDLLWIKRGFSDEDAPFEKFVVHGHTPLERPYFGQHRINLDTGAYLTGRLTCLVLSDTNQQVIEIK
jgi:serine/threonine protein phosphatase 1